GSRWGKLTALRMRVPEAMDPEQTLDAFRTRLRTGIDPFTTAFTAIPIRRMNVEASRGATDFGEYFVYFSFFLMVSALLLAGLFFRLGVEQRAQEVGLLEATGFAPRAIARLFLTEAAVLAVCGGVVGTVG